MKRTDELKLEVGVRSSYSDIHVDSIFVLSLYLNSKKWEGEDEEDFVIDSWDQEPEEVEREDDFSRTSGLDRSEDASIDGRLPSEVGPSPRGSEETWDRIYFRRLQEEDDLNLVKDVFGVQMVL